MLSYIEAYTRAVVPSTIVFGPRDTMTHHDLRLSVATYKLVDGIGTLLSKLLNVVSRYRLWRDRTRTIRILNELDDRTLADIGLERHLISEQVDSLIETYRRNLSRRAAGSDAALAA